MTPSRSSAMTCVSAETPGSAIALVSRGAGRGGGGQRGGRRAGAGGGGGLALVWWCARSSAGGGGGGGEAGAVGRRSSAPLAAGVRAGGSACRGASWGGHA